MWPSHAIVLLRYVNLCTGFNVVSPASSILTIADSDRNITSLFYVDLQAKLRWCSSEPVCCNYLTSILVVLLLWDFKNVFILVWLYVDSVPDVSNSIFVHWWKEDGEKCEIHNPYLLHTGCYSKCIWDLHSSLTLTIIPTCVLSIMAVNPSAHPHFTSTLWSSQPCWMPLWSQQIQHTGVDPAPCTFSGVVTDRKPHPLCSGLDESRTASQAPLPSWCALRVFCCCLPAPMTLASEGGGLIFPLVVWSTSQFPHPSGQKCRQSGEVCPQLQGWQRDVYVGAVEYTMGIVCVSVTKGV